jgi:hypothetical protein
VRYLGTVDCSRWPEAEAALAISLRFDRNECVRFEAALALRSGCCCTNKIMDALTNCVLGENKKDNFPIEKSERVRAAAADALARCPLIERPVDPDVKEKDERKVDARPILDPKAYYERVAQLPREQLVANARAVLVSMQQGGKAQPIAASANSPTVSAAPVAGINQRPAGLAGLFANAISPESAATANSPNGAPQSRAPFFSSLTKSLTGKQDGVIVRQETVVAAPTVKAPVYEVKAAMPAGPATVPTPAPIAAPPAPASKPVMPAEIRIDTKPVVPNVSIEIKQSFPAVDPPAAAAPVPMRVETKVFAPIEIKQTIPGDDAPLSGPRETSGSVEPEELPAPRSAPLPPIVLPPGSRR